MLDLLSGPIDLWLQSARLKAGATCVCILSVFVSALTLLFVHGFDGAQAKACATGGGALEFWRCGVPKRVIDFDAMWGSDKLASCAPWAQAEYAWLYGLADACGCFEITNLRVIWGRVAAIRGNLTLERLQQVFDEFQDKGLLFVWECDGKRYAHWTGSDVPGRLPAPSWRMRLERFAPPVPKKQLEEYMARFARGRAARVGGGFRGETARETAGHAESGRLAFSGVEERRVQDAAAPGEKTEEVRRARAGAGGPGDSLNTSLSASPNASLNGRLEEAQAQDLDLGLNLNGNLNGNVKRDLEAERNGQRCGAERASGNPETAGIYFSALDYKANSNSTTSSRANSDSKPKAPGDETADATCGLNGGAPVSRVQTNCEEPFDPRGRQDVRCPELHEARREWARERELRRGAPPRFGWSEKELLVAREIWVGQGPVCLAPPKRLREEKRLASGAGGSGGEK